MVSWNWEFDKDKSEFKAQAKGEEAKNEEAKNKAKEIENMKSNTNEFKYKFRITRHKDIVTKKEILEIIAFVKNNDGSFDDNDESISEKFELGDIDNTLIKLREYGIVFTDDNSRLKLKRHIEKSYSNIRVNEISDNDTKNVLSDEENKLDDFLYAIGEYVRADTENKERKNELLYVPVADFDQIAIDCGYHTYEINSLRRKLIDKKYIHTVGQRTTIVVRIANRPTRTIAFLENYFVENGFVKEYFNKSNVKEDNKQEDKK